MEIKRRRGKGEGHRCSDVFEKLQLWWRGYCLMGEWGGTQRGAGDCKASSYCGGRVASSTVPQD